LAGSFVPEGYLLVVDNRYLFVLVVLVVGYVWSEPLVEILVYNFGLSVGLRVIRGREL
jgi:hypothetical protein